MRYGDHDPRGRDAAAIAGFRLTRGNIPFPEHPAETFFTLCGPGREWSHHPQVRDKPQGDRVLNDPKVDHVSDGNARRVPSPDYGTSRCT